MNYQVTKYGGFRLFHVLVLMSFKDKLLSQIFINEIARKSLIYLNNSSLQDHVHVLSSSHWKELVACIIDLDDDKCVTLYSCIWDAYE